MRRKGSRSADGDMVFGDGSERGASRFLGDLNVIIGADAPPPEGGIYIVSFVALHRVQLGT